MRRNLFASIGLAVIFLGLAGCAAILPTPLTSSVTRKPIPTHPVLQELGLIDVCGAMEIHSSHSHDGKLSVGEIQRQAKGAGLDFCIITDHNTLRAREDLQIGTKPLMLVGVEISSSPGHLIAFNLREEISKSQPVEKIVEAIHAQGGIAIAGDPTSRKKPWKTWEVPVDGLSVVDLNRFLENAWIPGLIAKAALLPNEVFWESVVRRPNDTLAIWDEQTQHRPLVGTVSHDTHAHGGAGPFLIDSLASGFRLVRMHLWVKQLDAESIYEALENGRGYIGFDGWSPTTPMFFGAKTTSGWGLPGDRIARNTAQKIVVQLPHKAELVLYRNGKAVQHSIGNEAAWPVESAGVYRLEANLKGKPWIITNPIYIEEP